MSATLYSAGYPSLSASEKRYRLIIENSPDGIMTVSADGIITDITAAAEKILGYSKAEIVGRNIIHKLVYPADMEMVKIVLTDILDNPSKVTLLEARHQMPDGSFKWLEGSCTNLCSEPAVNAIVVNFRDISDRKMAQVKLQQSEEQLSIIYNSTVSPMWLLQVEDGGRFRFKSVNTAFISFFKISEGVVGKLSGEVYPLDDAEWLQQKYSEVVASGNISKFVTTNHSPGGKKIFEVTVVPVKDHTGRVKSILGVLSDITNQKKANEELKQLNNQLRQLASHLQNVREEERTNMAREIHDELGQQLTVLKMDISWLTKKLAVQDDNIQSKIKGALDLIDNTINTVRKIASELRPSILDNLGLAEAIDWQSSEFYKRTGITVKFSSNVQSVQFASDISINLFRIFQESLTNVARHANATEIICILNKAKNYLRLVVEDNGVGFDVKQQGKRKTLGLLGMRERIAMLKGKYIIESEPGKGTCVSVKVPLTASPND